MLITSLSIRNITYHRITMDIWFPVLKSTQIHSVLYLKGVVLIWTWWLNNTHFRESVWNQSSTEGFRNHSVLLESRAHLATSDERFWPQKTLHSQEETGLCRSYSQRFTNTSKSNSMTVHTYVEAPGPRPQAENTSNIKMNMDAHIFEPINLLSAEWWNL